MTEKVKRYCTDNNISAPPKHLVVDEADPIETAKSHIHEALTLLAPIRSNESILAIGKLHGALNKLI